MSTDFWSGLIDWIKKTVLEENNNISPGDLDLIHLVDTEDEVLAILDDFYNKFDHSPNF